MPFEEAKKGNMRKLFQALDASMQELYINSYGVMDTNLEEIFLKITEAACQEEESELLLFVVLLFSCLRGRCGGDVDDGQVCWFSFEVTVLVVSLLEAASFSLLKRGCTEFCSVCVWVCVCVWCWNVD